jgi:hypothetical protein
VSRQPDTEAALPPKCSSLSSPVGPSIILRADPELTPERQSAPRTCAFWMMESGSSASWYSAYCHTPLSRKNLRSKQRGG